MNCSGKHAAMLATCVANGWDVATYRQPDHPLQVAIADDLRRDDRRAGRGGRRRRLRRTAALDVARPGWPAPSAGWPSGSTATTSPTRDSARVADAIRQHPAYVSGSRRDERELLTAIPGAIGKAGAESCYAVALPDGRAFALKTDDGAARVRPVLMAAALERSGVLDDPGVDAEAVRRTGQVAAARRRRAGGGDPGLLLRPSLRRFPGRPGKPTLCCEVATAECRTAGRVDACEHRHAS